MLLEFLEFFDFFDFLMPHVSICLPTYEPQPAHLRAAIESVLAQTFTDWELIIHDDASRTDVEGMTRPYANDPRFRFHRSPVRRGIGGNWNMCMHHGSAPLVAYMFQDDLWHPGYLKRTVEILERELDVGFIAANHEYRIEGPTAAAATGIYKEVAELRHVVMKDGRIHRIAFLTSWIERGLRPNLIGEPSFVVLRRELMEDVGPFLEDMQQGLDAEYWIRCLLKSDGWWIAEHLGVFRIHTSAATAKNEESGAGRTDRLRIFKILINALPPGPMKTLAQSIRRRELLTMISKFAKRLVHYRR